MFRFYFVLFNCLFVLLVGRLISLPFIFVCFILFADVFVDFVCLIINCWFAHFTSFCLSVGLSLFFVFLFDSLIVFFLSACLVVCSFVCLFNFCLLLIVYYGFFCSWFLSFVFCFHICFLLKYKRKQNTSRIRNVYHTRCTRSTQEEKGTQGDTTIALMIKNKIKIPVRL